MRALLQIAIVDIILLLTFQTSSAIAKNLIDEIEGVYVVPGTATYQKCRDCTWVPVKNATDCLVIKRLTNESASIYMSTIQDGGNSCTIEEDYKFTIHSKNALFFQDSEMPLEKESDGIYVIKDRDRIKFNVQPRKIETTYMACGNSASTANVSFMLSSKQIPWKKQNKTASSQVMVNLFQYCPAWNRP